MSKFAIIAAGAAGYIFGARAGHQRYEQIRDSAQRVWRDPRVQEKTSLAADAVKEKAPEVKKHVAGAAKQAAHKATSVGSDDDSRHSE